jgi:hypothetical protein
MSAPTTSATSRPSPSPRPAASASPRPASTRSAAPPRTAGSPTAPKTGTQAAATGSKPRSEVSEISSQARREAASPGPTPQTREHQTALRNNFQEPKKESSFTSRLVEGAKLALNVSPLGPVGQAAGFISNAGGDLLKSAAEKIAPHSSLAAGVVDGLGDQTKFNGQLVSRPLGTVVDTASALIKNPLAPVDAFHETNQRLGPLAGVGSLASNLLVPGPKVPVAGTLAKFSPTAAKVALAPKEAVLNASKKVGGVIDNFLATPAQKHAQSLLKQSKHLDSEGKVTRTDLSPLTSADGQSFLKGLDAKAKPIDLPEGFQPQHTGRAEIARALADGNSPLGKEFAALEPGRQAALLDGLLHTSKLDRQAVLGQMAGPVGRGFDGNHAVRDAAGFDSSKQHGGYYSPYGDLLGKTDFQLGQTASTPNLNTHSKLAGYDLKGPQTALFTHAEGLRGLGITNTGSAPQLQFMQPIDTTRTLITDVPRGLPGQLRDMAGPAVREHVLTQAQEKE